MNSDRLYYCSYSCLIVCPWVWVGASDLPLTNRIEQTWCNITSEVRLQRDYGFSLVCPLAFLFAHSDGSQLPYELSFGEAHMARKARVASSQQPMRTEAFSSVAHDNWILPTATQRSFESFRWVWSPGQHLDFRLMKDLEAEIPIMDLTVSPKIHMLQALTPNETIFGDRTCKETMRLLGWGLIQED